MTSSAVRFRRSTPCSARARCPTSSARSAEPWRPRGTSPLTFHRSSSSNVEPPATSPEPQAASHELPSYIYDAETPRWLATPRHYAYLKIAEGCDYKCSFCIIPTLRGHYRSRPEDSIVREAERLAEGGVKELLLISQDTTFYGVDRHERGALARLLRRLNACGRPRVDSAALSLPDDDR